MAARTGGIVTKRQAKASKARPLSDREQLFCQARVAGQSQRDAAISAGYASSRAAQTGNELEARTQVQAELERLRTAIAARTVELVSTDAARVQREIEAVAFSDVTELFKNQRVLPMADWPEQARRAIASVKVKRYFESEDTEVETTEFRLWPKMDALKQLREHLGMITPADGAGAGTEIVVRVVRE
jgi:phage terminase small subunit